MILFFDTETTGKVDFRMPPDHECQPRLVQLAAMLTEDDGAPRSLFSFIVKPDGWSIPEEVAAIHGITDEIAARVGLPEMAVCRAFFSLLSRARLMVAHNLDFDETVMTTAMHRAMTYAEPFPRTLARFCTMKAATPVCRIPHANPRRPDDWKWPKLDECMRHFFNEEHAGAHDALADVRACARVYFKMREQAVAA